MAQENLIKRIHQAVKDAPETSPIAYCGREVLAELEKSSETAPYQNTVDEAVARAAKKLRYCNTTQKLLVDRFREFSN